MCRILFLKACSNSIDIVCAASSNIDRRNMSASFEHRIGICWVTSDRVLLCLDIQIEYLKQKT